MHIAWEDGRLHLRRARLPGMRKERSHDIARLETREIFHALA